MKRWAEMIRVLDTRTRKEMNKVKIRNEEIILV